ncbi:MAG: outer membrane beta-barrel protein [Polyangiaceae bacterium]
MRKALFLSVFALAGLVSFNAAAADELGEPGQIALGAERVFGLNFFSHKLELDGNESTTSGTSIGLIFNDAATPYTVPRVALDYMVADGVSIGGSLGYVSQSSETETKTSAGSNTQDNGSVSSFVIAPRVGYVIPVADGADFWVRGGITYYSRTVSPDQGDDSKDSGLGLGLEGMFVLSPIPGFGFSIGPTVDFGLSGTQDPGGGAQELDSKYTNFGLNAGVVGWF